MTKKDYIAFAAAFKETRPGEHWNTNKRVQWDLDVRASARVFAANNPRFDGARYIAACGGLFGV